MKRCIVIVWAICSLSCATSPDLRGTDAPEASPAPVAGIPDAEIGLRHSSVFEEPAPQPIAFNEGEPGESELRERAFPGAPPVVSHSLEGIETITTAENACLECHDVAAAADVGATPIPPSHYRDLRNAPETERQEVAGARYICTTCHVAQTAAKPLVGELQN